MHYYPFRVNLYRGGGSCNTLNDLSNKVYIRHKSEDLNRGVFNLITGVDEWKMLTKHANVNVDSIVENVTRIKIEITIKFGASVKICEVVVKIAKI